MKKVGVPLAAALLFTGAGALAGPLYDRAEFEMKAVGIPYWIDSAQKLRKARANPPNSQFTDTWKQLDAAIDPLRGQAPLARATDPHSAEEVVMYATWLRYKIVVDNADARYSYAYAYDLIRMAPVDHDRLIEAATFVYDARLAMDIDGSRCKDKSGVASVVSGFEQQQSIHQVLDKLHDLSVDDRNAALLSAVALEQERGARPAMAWLCNAGDEGMGKALEQGQRPRPISENTPDPQGKTLSLDVSGVAPDYIPEADWQKLRQAKLDQVVHGLTD